MASPPVVHNQLLGLIDVEREVVLLEPLCQVVDLSTVGCLVIVRVQGIE